MQHIFLQPPIVLSLVLIALLLMLGIDLLLHDTIRQIFGEGHTIEFLSGVYFLVAAALLVTLLPARHLRRQWHLPVILMLISLREFDMDKALTTEGILQLRLYSGPAPLAEKIAGAMVVALILVCAWRLAFRSLADFAAGLRAGRAESWLTLLAAFAVVVSKTLDGLDRKLASLGWEISAETMQWTTKTEEMLELAASIMLVMAVVHGCRRLQAGTD